MTIGSGSQLNIYVFELVRLRQLSDGAQEIETVAIHPLLTAPAEIRYNDSSRSSVREGVGSALDTRGGRALRPIFMRGTFGVEERGIGPFRGTGDIRFRRFYREIVRLGEAMTRDQVAEALQDLHASPDVRLAAQRFDPDTDIWCVNLRDFWDGVHVQVQVQRFQHTRSRTSASGRIDYTMDLMEVGPAVANRIVGQTLDRLMSFMSTWQQANSLLASNDAIDQLDALAEFAAIPAALTADSVDALQQQAVGASALMGAGGRVETLFPLAATNGTGALFGAAQRVRTDAIETVWSVRSVAPADRDRDRGRPRWFRQPDAVPDMLDNFEAAVAVLDVEQAAAVQEVAGVFFGMSREVYQDWISSSGGDGVSKPEISGSVEHVVADYETPAAIEDAYGVSWARILDLNELLPYEALQPGTTLQIPVLRAAGPQGIDGLPTFGSHVGQAAWGIDLDLSLDYDSDSTDLLVVSGPDVLEQGATVMVEEGQDRVLKDLESIPTPAMTSYVAERFRTIFEADERIAFVESLDVSLSGALMSVSAQLRAINGGTILAGGRR